METNELLNNYRQVTDKLLNKIKLLNEKQIMFQPNRDDSWNVYQHFSHLVQTQIESINRTMLLLIKSEDLNIISESIKWIKIADDLRISMPISIAIFDSMVNFEVEILKNIQVKDMEIMKLQCRYHGVVDYMNPLENVESSIFHIDFHHEYIQKNINEFIE